MDAVSLGLDDGDRIGVVGRNGEGKSTLLRVLARLQEPDGGRVTTGREVRLGALWQEDRLDPEMTVRQAVMGDMAPHEWAGDAKVRDVLGGLLGGLEAPFVGGLDAQFGRLSGGQRRRVGLAALLISDDDLVMLDEPTNHLDVEGVAWLAQHLNQRWPAGRGGLLVVTHDRWFLDAVCGSIWEVHDGVVDSYEGGYAAYVLTRAERARVAAVTEERRQNTLRKELAWLRRGPPARTSKPQFRIDAAESLIADEPPPRDQMNLAKMATARLGKDVVDLEDVTVTVGSGDEAKTLLEHVTWRIGPGDRIGVVGVNGSGKTTLMKMMLGGPGAPVPTAGRVKRGKTVQAVILSQDVRELDAVADQKVQEAVEKVKGTVRIGGKDVTAGQLLERLGFTKDKIWTRVSDLSGGERRRLQLLRLLMSEPNVLLLDEPTNDLDTDTLAAIEDTLDEWPGTLIVVSHDRYLLERICDKQVALLGDGQIRDLPGGVEEYLKLRAQQEQTGVSSPTSTISEETTPVATAADTRAARKEMARIERQISKLASREEKLHAQMAEKATDHAAISKLDAELREVTAEKDALEEAWLEAAELAG
nr:ABC-F family ATP-binding cassette domain-containing protein [Kineosporia mesophila]